MRRINLVFLAFLLSAVSLLAGALHLAHGIQMGRGAPALLERARRAEADRDLAKAEELLSLYLNMRREDGPAWRWYARIVDRRETDRRGRDRVYLIQMEALGHNPGDMELGRRCAELALDLGRYGDARSYLTDLIDRLGTDSGGRAASELEELLGQCHRGQSRFDEAERSFREAIEHDPARISCYMSLARLLRLDLRRGEAAADAIRSMVGKNPDCALAYVRRWWFAQEFAPPGDPGDVRKALELAPDDPEVRLAAAVACEQGHDPAGARVHWEKGWGLDPGNATLAVGLARLEVRDGHLDRAEAVLRRACEANASVDLAFELAEVLIFRGKIEGDDQAEGYLARLRAAGFGETLVRFLEAEILVQERSWAAAITRMERDRAVLRPFPRLSSRLDLMLADCYGRMGADELRLEALRRAADGDRGPESARIELARGLSASGQADRAISILTMAAVRSPERRLDLIRLLIERTARLPEDRRDWQEVEAQLREAERSLPGAQEPLTLLKAAMIDARNRPDQARSLLDAAQARDPRNLRYRLAVARLAQRQGQDDTALRIIDRAEKELGPSPDLRLARLDYWGLKGGDAAIAAVARLEEETPEIPAPDRPAFLGRLAAVEIGLGRPARAREHLRRLSALQPDDVRALTRRLDLAVQAGDHADALELAGRLRAIEGERGTLWRFGHASVLLDQARRGAARDLEAPRVLAAEVAALRPEWWGSPILLAEIAELEGRPDEAIKNYTRAIELGNYDPSVARRLAGLLDHKGEIGTVERVARILSDRGASAADLTISAALGAIRRQDYDRGIALARQAFSESSTNYADHLFMGQFYLAARRSGEAGKELRRAVDLGPGVPITWVSYIRYLVSEKQVDQARTTLEAARKALPPERANLALAQCYAMVGEVSQAERMIRAALRSPNCDLATIRAATDLYINLGRFDQVEPILDKLRDPSMGATSAVLAWANRTRSLARLSTGRLDEMDRAFALVDENLRANPSSPDDLRLKAILLAARTGRRADAIKLLEPLERSNQLGPSEQFILAQTYLAEGLVDKYRDQMLKLLGAGVRNPRHLAHFIDFLIGRRDLDQADRWLAEWKRMAPQSPVLLEREARLLDLRGRRPELRDLLQARGRQAPDDIGAVAGLLDRFGFAGEAEAAYKAFIVRKPGEPERVLALASFLARQDRTREAITLLDEAWKTCRPEAVAGTALALFVAPSADQDVKRRVEAWVSAAIQESPAAAAALRPKLATIYCRQGRYDEAEALFRRILRSDAENVEALNNLAWELALREPAEAREALALIDRAIEKAGRISTLLDTRAVALIRAGEPDRALQELRDAQAADPKNVSLALHLAWAYQDAGKAAEARKAFRHAGELGIRPETRHPLERKFIERLRSQLCTDEPSPSNRG